MNRKLRVFLDTSALFAGIWSAEGGVRMILKLGEAGALQIVIGRQVLHEIDEVLQRKAPQLLPSLAVLLDRSRVDPASDPPNERVDSCKKLVSHPGDALNLAEAWNERVDYLVTLDREHFLDVPGLPEQLPFPLGTPGDFLAWYRSRLRGLPRIILTWRREQL
jgi:predicted nucleic acid-binding protein